ncbi:MAG: hypothetical protein GTN67_04860 [Hydrotalea flava]|uniref:hypothetical protein n=1 Tax=Hydrotalea TaxID=1004300 RepID=UPI000942BCA7|nr:MULTISPECIES: hypothetical protein [Hydrotalea]MBY0348486.1 hypothetical protein [Hydrotalea flava]NIM34769.1 hypothetical protein [Hydrotalea flava]NIM37605.1 hypothetical protein [Hydrotalea flava]NIN02765.1 hypothetical protein [Hydrotalea flava]NIN14450.1 hypothetical protein [Hydrotalea flava]
MKKVFFYIFIIFATITSCKKDFSDEFTPYQGMSFNDTTWTNEPISNDLIDSLQVQLGLPMAYYTTFNPTHDTAFWLNNDIQLKIPAYTSAYVSNTANPVTDPVYLRLITLKERGDFIRYLISTTFNQYPLVCAADFYVSFTSNNQPIAIAPAKPITIQWMDDNVNNAMQFYSGSSNTGGQYEVNWQQDNNGSVTRWDTLVNGMHKTGYRLQSPHLQWMGANYLMDTTQATTNLNVVLPLNFNNKNTIAFAVFNNVKSVIRLTPSAIEKGFYTTNLPTNANITIVSISLINNSFYLGTNTLFGLSAGLQKLYPKKISVQSLNVFLNSL